MANDLTIIFYTANRISQKIMAPVVRSIKKHGYPIVSVSQKPMDLGHNIVVEPEYSLQNIYKQVLVGAKAATTKYVALCEDDCLYTKEHFEREPTKSFSYNRNRWQLHLREGLYSFRDKPVLSQCIAIREDLIKNLEERNGRIVPDKICGEMGIYDKKIGITQYEYETFVTPDPNMVICHKYSIMGRKLLGNDAPPTKNLKHWGDAEYWLKKFDDGTRIKPRRQHSHIASTILDTAYVHANRMEFVYPGKEKYLEWFMKACPVFLKAVIENNGAEFTDEELRKFDYYDYLMSRRHIKDRHTVRGDKRVLWLMRDFVGLYHDIKNNGLKNPLDVWVDGDRYVLYRGGRRLEILKSLGIKKIPFRVFKTKDIFEKLQPGVELTSEDSIHNLGMKQFQKHLHFATDKYWVHGYLKLYDTHIGYLRNTARKILEMGVFRGASLLLWRDAFKKAQIYGVDKKVRKDMMITNRTRRITTFKGLQEDEVFMKQTVLPAGPFDIIIDDAGHKPLEMRKALQLMWKSVKPSGWYIIEDLYGNYRKGRIEHTIMEELKDMIDEMNRNCEIQAMHFYYNICFIQKAR